MPRLKGRSNKVGPSTSRNEDSSHAEDRDGTTLHECVRNGSIDTLKKLLKKEECLRHVNDPDDLSLTPLHYAAKAHNLEACKLLLTDGKANPVAKDEDGAFPLHYACRRIPVIEKDAKAVIELLLSKGCPRLDKCCDDYGSTPLHIAAIRGNITAVKTILGWQNEQESGGEDVAANIKAVDVRDRHQCTPLHEAATYNQVTVAELLIRNGCSLYVIDNDGCTPLHLACAEGSLDMVKVLLDNCKERTLNQLINQPDDDNTTALQYAIKARNLELVTELVRRGAEIDSKRSDKAGGGTALHLAVITGEKAIVEYLLKENADVNATDSRHCTVLHLAAQYNWVAVADVLTQHGSIEMDKANMDGLTPLLIAAVHGSDDVLTMLLERHVNVKATDKSEQGILHLAVRHQRESSVRIILEHIRSRAEELHDTLVNGMDKLGLTPLHLASQNGNLVIVKMLLDAGADVFVKDETEETPFLQAAERGHVHIMKELKIHNEKVINDEDEFSNTCLHKAAENGHLEAVKVLTVWGADKDARNNKYWTPLNMAVVNGQDEVVNFLLDEKASPNAADKNGNTALHVAAEHGHANVIKKLISGGADIAALDKSKMNCLDVAIANGHRNAALAILKSNAWHKALANDRPYKDGKKPRNTPLRELFRQMPDVASVALSNCMHRGRDEAGEYIEFNFDFLDDSYINYSTLTAKNKVKQLADEEDDEHYYTSDKNWVKKNHPLSVLLNEVQNEELVRHPLVLALIRHKWKAIRPLYYAFLAFYACFVAMVTGYMLALRPPYEQVDILPNDTMNSWCAKIETEVGCPPEDKNAFYEIAAYIIWCMCLVGAIVEIIQLSSQRILYFQPLNLLDWYTYISAVLITLNGPVQIQCGVKLCWQWQMAAFTVFFSWCDLLLFVRRLPALGIYVVMVVEILKTFAKFFIVFFLFIVAFAVSFHLLIQNQAPFNTPFYAISKTWVMMLGEMDYGTIFHEELQPFESAMFALFWLFLMLMAIIVMNLLTGLAVDDVNLLRQKAKIVRLRLQVDLALGVELAMPRPLRKLSKATVRRDRIYLDESSITSWKVIENVQAVIEGPLLTKSSVINAENNLVQHDGEERLEKIDLEARMNKRLHNMEKIINDILLVHYKGYSSERDSEAMADLSSDAACRCPYCSCCRGVTEKKPRIPTNSSTVKSGSGVGQSHQLEIYPDYIQDKTTRIESDQEVHVDDKSVRILLGENVVKTWLGETFPTKRTKKEDRVTLISSDEEDLIQRV